MSVVLVVDVLVVVVLVVLVLVVVGGSAHEGTPPVQLHRPALQEEMIPLLHIRFALPFKPTHRALMDGLQLFGLHGLRASVGEAEMPSPRTTPSTKAAILPYCIMSPLRRVPRHPIAGSPSGSSAASHVSWVEGIRQPEYP